MEIHDLRKAQWSVDSGTSAGIWREVRFFGFVALILLATGRCLLAAVSDGYVVKVESTTVYLDWGAASGIGVGHQFEVFRPGDALKHPVTGENLGQTKRVVGDGVIDSVQEKFSTGRIVQGAAAIRAGDRTHLQASPDPAPPRPAAEGTVPEAQGPAAGPVPREIWRSDPFNSEATGISTGDIDGDGRPELIVAFRNSIDAYRWTGQKLEALGSFKARGVRNFLAVDTANIDGTGKDQVFATLFVDGNKRARTLVLEWQNGELKEVGRLDGFVRAFWRGGKRELLWQDASMSRELRIRAPAFVVKKGRKFSDGDAVALPRALNDDQLFGYVWGDWDGDGAEDFGFLQNGDRLRLFLKDAKWSSSSAYGGSRTDFSWEGDQIGSVYPRLISLPAPGGKAQLLVPHNIQLTPVKFSRLKLYKQSQLFALTWNGLEMLPAWKIPVAGALSDFCLLEADGTSRPLLWIAAVGAGNKTVLLAYRLP